MRGYTEVKLAEKTIPLRFCHWSLSRFCEINGLTYAQMGELFGGGFTPKQITSLLLCAAEYFFAKDEKPFPFTEFDASEWIDEMGGVGGAAFSRMMQVMVDSVSDPGADTKKKAVAKK